MSESGLPDLGPEKTNASDASVWRAVSMDGDRPGRAGCDVRGALSFAPAALSKPCRVN